MPTKKKEATRVVIGGWDLDDMSDEEIDRMTVFCVRLVERAMSNPRVLKLMQLATLAKAFNV